MELMFHINHYKLIHKFKKIEKKIANVSSANIKFKNEIVRNNTVRKSYSRHTYF